MTSHAIEALLSKARLEGEVIGRGHARFQQARRVWNHLADKQPAAVVKARSVTDIQATLRVAAESGCLLAVRCGAHSLPGLSTCDDGIVLDLSELKEITIDRQARMADVAGGALLGDLDRTTSEAGFVVPAGVVSHTGVAGLTLGGGMGWLSRRYGLTIDNLLATELVTASGDVHWIDEETEPELFWGLRGGGGNFGVVSRFRFKLNPLDPITVGAWLYPSHEGRSVLRTYQELLANAPRHLTGSFSWYQSGFALTLCWSGDPQIAEAALRPFGRLGKAESGSIAVVPYVMHQSRHDLQMDWGRRHYSKGGFLGELTHDVAETLEELVELAPSDTSDIYGLQLGGTIGDVDEDATAYSGRNAEHYWITSASWDVPKDDEKCMTWGRSAAKRVAAISLAGNYVNEQGDTGKDVALQAYGQKKFARLQALKTKYDPANLFRLNQNIPPLTS